MHVVESLDIGGLERMVVALADWQRRQEGAAPVTIACLFHEGPLAKQARALGLAVHAAGKRRGPDVAALWRLRGLLRAAAGDGPLLLHTHNPMAQVYTAAASVGLPVAALVNTRHGMGATRPGARQERLYRAAMRRADAAVAVCEAARAHYLAQGIFAAGRHSAVVPNGIDLAAAADAPADRLALRRALGCADDELLVGSVGRLVPVKDQATLLQAVALLRRGGRRVRLVLVGDGECRAALAAQAAGPDLAGAVHLLGQRDDVPRLLPAFDVLALSSLAEGWPLSLLEAAAAGLPCVASAVGGVPELVSAGGLGLLVPPGDAAALAQALARLADDPAGRAATGAAARRWALGSAGIDTMGRRYEALYAPLLARRSARLRWHGGAA